jgi:radical SAM protein with 4Fe4S-binding SPASM domain
MLEDHLRLKAPLIAQFEITPACNNNCGFCYNFWEYDGKATLSRKSSVDEGKIRRLMDLLLSYEVPAVCFTGGEPLLERELLFGLLERASQENLYTSINTNGRLIDHDAATRMKELGLRSALVSLHGDSRQVHEEATGCQKAYAETVRGIERLVAAGVNTTVNYVATQKNVERIVPTATMLNALGVKSMTVTPLLPFPGVKDHQRWAMRKEQFRQYFDALALAKEGGLKVDSTLPVAPCILKDLFPDAYESYLAVLSPRVCMAGVSFMAVSPEGFNRACIQAPQLEEYGGDIGKGFEDAWKRSHEWSRAQLLPQDCLTECYALAACGGGCRTSALAENDSAVGKTMYMGQPIALEDAKPFIDRMAVDVDRHDGAFRKRKDVKLREEDFGGVLANTSRQSFVVLDHDGVRTYRTLPDEFSANGGSHGIAVLYAAGMLEPIRNDEAPPFNGEIAVVHASKLYERLAGKLPLDEKVRMLRADTGERVYF